MTSSPNCVFFLDRGIKGIAAVGDEVFVIRHEQSYVSVYDSDTLREASHNIPLADTKSPRYLAGCSYNKALYIIGDGGHILRVGITDNSVTKWDKSKDMPLGLSVTAKHTLLVTVEMKYLSLKRSGVKEYTSTGWRMRVIIFHSEIRFPWHILQLSSDNFIMCHGGSKYPLGRICVVNILGQVINSYDGRQEGQDEILQIHKACSIAMDDKSGSIFIADHGNHKILMLNTDLKYQGQIFTPRYFRSPSHLCFDSTHGRLLAGSFKVAIKSNETRHGDSWEYLGGFCKNHGNHGGVAVLDKKIFVIRLYEPIVDVYDSQILTTLYRINIPDMINCPCDRHLAVCAYNRALYISERSGKCIHRVDLTNNSATSWKMRENHDPEKLSVTAEHTLLVTVSNDYRCVEGDMVYEPKSIIMEYSSEGQLLREINLEESIKHAWHTVQLSSDQFIVCYGLGLFPPQGVSVVNTEGQLITSSGGEIEGGGHPSSLAVDYSRKHIFAAYARNNRVLVLNTDLTYLGEVHVAPDLEEPYFLCIDSSTDKLFVSEWLGRLFVVSLLQISDYIKTV